MGSLKIKTVKRTGPPRHEMPVNIIHDSEVTTLQMKAVIEGIKDLCALAGVADSVNLHDLGAWREADYRVSGQLVPYQSVDWYLQEGSEKSERPGQLNGSAIIKALLLEPWRRETPHFDVMVVSEDMYDGTDENNFVIGLASSDIGAVLSVVRFNDLPSRTQFDCIKTETMHELGHVFGLPNRDFNVETSLGLHCTNTCTMRQGLVVPDDWVRITQDRLHQGALCSDCLNDLRRLFNTA